MVVELKIVDHVKSKKFYVGDNFISEKSLFDSVETKKNIMASILNQGIVPRVKEVLHREGKRKRIVRNYQLVYSFKLNNKLN